MVLQHPQVSRPRSRPGQNEPESRDHGLEITTLLIESHKWQIDSVCANDLATGVRTKHVVLRPRPILGLETMTDILDFRSRELRPRPRPGPSGLETKTETLGFLGFETETWAFRSRDQDGDLDKMNSNALEPREHISRSQHWLLNNSRDMYM